MILVGGLWGSLSPGAAVTQGAGAWDQGSGSKLAMLGGWPLPPAPPLPGPAKGQDLTLEKRPCVLPGAARPGVGAWIPRGTALLEL